jgi:large subunit ribosomal protein L9
MEVILKEDVANLGHRGDLVKVADGYGRNFLLPRKLALQATQANKAVVEQMKSAAARRSATEKAQAEQLAVKLEPVVLSFTRKSGEAGHLFGSVTSADIAAVWKPRASRLIAARSSWKSLSRAWASSAWPSSSTAKSSRT